MKIRTVLAAIALAVVTSACSRSATAPEPDQRPRWDERTDTATVAGGHSMGSGG